MAMDAVYNRTEKPRVQTAARTVEILRYVGLQSSAGVSAKQISDDLSIPRQVVYHLIHTLVETDMLRKVGGSSYALGFGVAAIADGFKRQLTASGMMADLADQAAKITGETAYIVGWVGGEIVVVASAAGTASVRAGEIAPGTAGDAHARASGKMLLSMVHPSDLDRYLSAHELRKRTENTIIDMEILKRQLAEARDRGFAVENQEYAQGLSCLAVPIGKMPSQIVLGLSAPSERFNENVDRYVERLKDIAKR
ncbi:IclR family transcriptional regulator [Mesorhizobium sp. M0098]|uniref:IclR family transcriptional regulator n=2 Tax=unclassified Mesorhizobium TaxID=325217 RepID=UPI00333B9F2E